MSLRAPDLSRQTFRVRTVGPCLLLVTLTFAWALTYPIATAVAKSPAKHKTQSGCNPKAKTKPPPQLSSPIPTRCPNGLVNYLVEVPNFASPSGSTNVDLLEQVTAGLALGMTAAIATISAARYYLAGVARGGGASELIESVAKTALAVGAVVGWRWLFTSGVGIANGAANAVLAAPGVPSVGQVLTGIWDPGGGLQLSILGLLGSNPISFLATLIVDLLALVALAVVLVMKISLSATSSFLYVAAPIAIVLWPINELRWVTELAGKAATACLLVPLVWALLFAAFAAVGVGSIANPVGVIVAGTFWQTLGNQIVAIALLYALIAVPRGLLRQATAGAGSGGGVLRQAVSFTSAQFGSQAVQHVVRRTVDRVRGPQAMVTRDSRGSISGYTETAHVRGRGRQAAQSELEAARHPDFATMEGARAFPEPAEPPAKYEGRLARQRRARGAGVSDAGELARGLQSLPRVERNGVMSLFDRHVRALDGSGAPARKYDAFWTTMAAAAADERLAPGTRGVYRSLAAASGEALDQVFHLGSANPSGTAGGASSGPASSAVPAPPGSGGQGAASSTPRPSPAPRAARSVPLPTRSEAEAVADAALLKMVGLLDEGQVKAARGLHREYAARPDGPERDQGRKRFEDEVRTRAAELGPGPIAHAFRGLLEMTEEDLVRVLNKPAR